MAACRLGERRLLELAETYPPDVLEAAFDDIIRRTEERLRNAFGTIKPGVFEFLPRTVLEMVLRNVPATRDPFSEPHPWYVLMEISGAKPDGYADRVLSEVLEAASQSIASQGKPVRLVKQERVKEAV